MSTESVEPADSTLDYTSPNRTASRVSVGKYLGLTALVLLIVVGIIGGLAYIKYSQIAAAMAMGGWPEPANAVVIVPAQTEPWQPTISTTGTVVATRFVMLQNEEAGTVREINMKSGQIVEEGQVLMRLDTAVEAAELRAAVARQQLAELQLDRAKKSSQMNAVSANELDQAKAALDEAIAVSQQLQARIDRKTIKAPFKATVGIVDWQLGQYLQQGESIAALTGVDDHVFVDFAVPQEMAGKLPFGLPIPMNRLDAPETVLTGTLASDDMMLSDRTRTTRTRAKLNNTASLRPGMSLNVRLPAAIPQQVVTVPATSIRRSAWGDFVFTTMTDPQGNTRAQQVSVTVGPSLGERVIIRKGVTAGMNVIADGSFKLREGALVATAPTTQPTTQTAAN
jgi:membrane fusion protein, multidrug efflux system